MENLTLKTCYYLPKFKNHGPLMSWGKGKNLRHLGRSANESTGYKQFVCNTQIQGINRFKI